MAGYSPWGHKSVRHNLVTIQQHTFYMKCKKKTMTLYFHIQYHRSCIKIYILCVCVLSHFSHIQLFETLWTVAYQAPLPMGFSRQEYWHELPCPPPGDLPKPGIKWSESQSCSTLCPHGLHIVHQILQARILEWVADPFSRSSQPRNQPGSPALQADSLPTELSGKPI